MKVKDFNAQFEKMKKFKEDHKEVIEDDEFFKAMYSRLRKYIKKYNKVCENEDKSKKGETLTKDQKDQIKTKKEVHSCLEEMHFINEEYMKNFDNHCKQIWALKPQEETKQEEPQEEEKVEEPAQEEPEPQVDTEAIRQEGYEQGFKEGRDAGYAEGRNEGLESGRNEGYSNARDEFSKSSAQAVGTTTKAAKYSALINIMAYWIDSFQPLKPQFKRNDFFTEEECYAIKQIFFANQSVPNQINFKQMVDANSDRVLKMINGDSQEIQYCPNITFKSLGEAFDRVLDNDHFCNTIYEHAQNAEIIGMGAMGGMPGYLPNPMMGQMPGMMPGQPGLQTPAQMHVETKVAGNVGAFEQPAQQEPVPVAHPEPQEQEVRLAEVAAQAEQPAQAEAKAPATATENVADSNPLQDINNQVWNDDDDEDDDDEEDEEPHEEEEEGHHEEVAPAGATQVEAEHKEEEGQGYHHPHHKPRGRGFGYNNRGYPRGGRGYNNRGYNRGYNNRGYGPRGGRRGNNRYRNDRGGRGREYYESQYHQEQEAKKEPEPKFDEDGFEIMKEKTFTKKKRKTGTRGGKPKQAHHEE